MATLCACTAKRISNGWLRLDPFVSCCIARVGKRQHKAYRYRSGWEWSRVRETETTAAEPMTLLRPPRWLSAMRKRRHLSACAWFLRFPLSRIGTAYFDMAEAGRWVVELYQALAFAVGAGQGAW